MESPPRSSASSVAPPGAVPIRHVALPALVVLVVVLVISALIPLAIAAPLPAGVQVPYWSLLGYLALCCVGLLAALVGAAARPIPGCRSGREAALLLTSIIGAGGYALGFILYQIEAVLPQIPSTLVGASEELLSLGMLVCYLALGGVSLGGALHLWLVRRQLPRAVARFTGSGVAVAAVLAAVALVRNPVMGSSLGPLLLFALGALVTLPVGVFIAGRVLPHAR